MPLFSLLSARYSFSLAETHARHYTFLSLSLETDASLLSARAILSLYSLALSRERGSQKLQTRRSHSLVELVERETFC